MTMVASRSGRPEVVEVFSSIDTLLQFSMMIFAGMSSTITCEGRGRNAGHEGREEGRTTLRERGYTKEGNTLRARCLLHLQLTSYILYRQSAATFLKIHQRRLSNVMALFRH
jgi:hypothetical protein